MLPQVPRHYLILLRIGSDEEFARTGVLDVALTMERDCPRVGKKGQEPWFEDGSQALLMDEVKMGSVRFSVASVMGLVAGLALDLAVIRAWLIYRTDGRTVFNTIDVLGIGGLPMANILMIVLIASRTRPSWRPFLVGFLGAGILAMACFFGLAFLSTELLVMPYLHALLRPISKTIPRNWSVVRTITFHIVSAMMLGLPQLILATLVGMVARMSKNGVRSL